jgi:hypothetical protein
MQSGRSIVTAGALVVFLAAAGCGGKPVSVEGVVTLDGKPVSGAMVVFHPEKGGTQASALTDSEGVFNLTTFNTGDGAFPGSYRVTVQKLQTKGDAVTSGVDPADPESMHKAIGGYLGQDPRKEVRKAQPSSLPSEYGNPDTSGLKYQVPASGSIKIALKSGGGT